MDIDRELETREFNRALEILTRELDELRVSPRQKRAYRFFTWSFLLVFTGLVVWAMIEQLVDSESVSNAAAFEFVGPFVAGLGMLLMMLLFLLNLGLVHKLWRMGRIRRQLGLAKTLAPAFKAQRRQRWFRNLLTAVLVGIGTIYIFLAVIIWFMIAPDDDIFGELSIAEKALVSLLYLIFGLSLASLHYIRRGMERLAIVEELRSDLRAAELNTGRSSTEGIKIASANYELIAKLERNQIIQERQQSIQRAQDRTSFGYAVQTSFTAQEAKDRLPAHERTLIDEQILKLLKDPQADQERVIIDAESGLRRLSVRNTSAEIRYRIDDARQLIQIPEIRSVLSIPDDSGARQ